MKRREILAQAGLFAGALAASKFSTAAERKYTIALVMKALSNPFSMQCRWERRRRQGSRSGSAGSGDK